MRVITEELQEIIDGQSGKPQGLVYLYDTNFPYPSKGFKAEYFNYQGHGSKYIKPGESTVYNNMESIDIYINGDNTYGIPILDTNGERVSYIDNSLRFNWGSSPPIGLNPFDLRDKRRWAVRWSGYFYVDSEKPETYSFGIVSSSKAQITVGGKKVAYGVSPNKITSNESITLTGKGFVPIVVTFVLVRDNVAYPSNQDYESFVGLWKKESDTDWKVLDCSRVVDGFSYENINGNLITELSDIPTILQEPGEVRELIKEDSINELKLTPGSGLVYTNLLYLNDVMLNILKSPIEISDIGDTIKLELNEDSDSGSLSYIYGPSFLEPLVSPSGLPGIINISENHSSAKASTISFSVNVTDADFNEEDINKNNCYTYYGKTESFGVLRKGRLVDIFMGYRVNGNKGAVQRFRGFIDKINVQHNADGTKRLDVNCTDLSKMMDDVQAQDCPKDISYNTFNLFSDNPYDTAGRTRPLTYDSWKLVDVIRDLAYSVGLTSEQLYAKDSGGRYLIEDVDDRLLKSVTYPFKSRTLPEGTLSGEYLHTVSFGDNIWNRMQELAEEFGRRLYFNMDGNLVLSRPNNPKIFSEYYTGNVNINSEDWVDSSNVQIVKSPKALRGFSYFVREDSMKLKFRGVGISIVIYRSSKLKNGLKLYLNKFTTNSFGVPVDTEKIHIDGLNILDSETNHRGSLSYITKLEDGSYPTEFKVLGEDTDWYYKDGIHPRTGDNPCVIQVCDNLTYGDYELTIERGFGESQIPVEGFLIYKTNVYNPVKNLSGVNGNVSISAEDSDTNMRNVVNVIGATIGGGQKVDLNNSTSTSVSKVNNTVVSVAKDVGSLKDSNASNYLGKERSVTIVNPAIRDQNRADFIAQYLLKRYRRNYRNPSLQIIGSPELELYDCISVEDVESGFYSPIIIETGNGQEVLKDLPDPLDRFWVTDISSSMDNTGKYISNIKATPLEPQPSFEIIPDPPEEQFGSEPAFKNIEITQDGTSDSTYNAYEEDARGKYIKINYDQIFNARRIYVKVISNESHTYSVSNLSSEGAISKTLLPNQQLYTLKYEEGFIPSGNYTLFWNGWWADEGEGGSKNGGRYVPTGTKVIFEFYIEKYSDGKPYLIKSTDTRTNVVSGSVQEVTMQISNTDETGTDLYTGDAFSVSYEPNNTYSGASVNSQDLYYFSDQNSEYKGSMKTIVTTNRPGGIYFALAIYTYTYFSKTNNVNDWYSRVREKYIYPINGDFKSDIDISDAGEYIYFISPGQLIVNGHKEGEGISYTVPEGLEQQLNSLQIDKATRRIGDFSRFDVPIQSNVRLYFEYFSNPDDYDPTDAVFKLWLVRIPGDREYDSKQTGFVFQDKNGSIFVHDTSDKWISWLGDTNQYEISILNSDSDTDKLIDNEDLILTFRDVPTSRIKDRTY